jgi:hypothetical protein
MGEDGKAKKPRGDLRAQDRHADVCIRIEVTLWLSGLPEASLAMQLLYSQDSVLLALIAVTG